MKAFLLLFVFMACANTAAFLVKICRGGLDLFPLSPTERAIDVGVNLMLSAWAIYLLAKN